MDYRNCHIQQEVRSHWELFSPCFVTGLSDLVHSDVRSYCELCYLC